jgi:hypothetical protein
MGGDDIFVFILLLGLLLFVSLVVSGLIIITEPLFQNNNITLTNPNLGIAKMATTMCWLSLPITVFMTAKIISKVAENPISIGILSLGLITLLSFILYGLTILSLGLFKQDGVYINSLPPSLTQPTITQTPTPSSTTPSTTPPAAPPTPPTVYTDTLTINCLKIATIFAWLSIAWNVFFFIKETSDF